ncbi:hypothetical protein AG1IA_07108 [Rhizoctonia solani AG-1 IA]|uniref:Uncharacterized protein n=1 Tax=Thanatephorus cucumeris (strain AG1-IA) TaxID=983506 RepID=L8WR84_THACA|nr:hypothetical protein AG1IA_07108 [Rhizoctonia solani AG-1 IA]
MLGRVVLLWVNKKVPLAEIVPPMYPIAMNVTNTIVPKRDRIITESIGWIASFGQAGSAVFPFMTGALAEKCQSNAALVSDLDAVGLFEAYIATGWSE